MKERLIGRRRKSRGQQEIVDVRTIRLGGNIVNWWKGHNE